MVQIWVNLPAKDKETTPKYQDLLFDDMTKVQLNENSFINVIAGSYKEQKGKGTTFSPIDMYNAYLQKGTNADFTFPKDWSTAILVIEGSVKVNEETDLKKDSFAMFENDTEETFILEATSDNTIVLIMSGKPLNEPIAHYGPFVMNTQEQLAKAFEEFQSGKFGKL
ncbi:pirin family protein [Chryseobacterium indoltheticum]|uniref:pirin family protein n=1 Tax=Chryseobacterium indoltheticum TaxID=254 RepID=UPI003F498E47